MANCTHIVNLKASQLFHIHHYLAHVMSDQQITEFNVIKIKCQLKFTVLCGMQDGRFTIWYHPTVVYTDKDPLYGTISRREGR